MNGDGSPFYGGQALIEGVMMRGPRKMAMAVRRPQGDIVVHEKEIQPWSDRWPLLKLPVLRGAVAIVEALVIGIDALIFSANQAAVTEEEQLTKGQVTLTMFIAGLLSVVIFLLLPTWAVHFLERWIQNGLLLNFLEGMVRLAILALYIAAISLMPDIKRVLQYHGAEHKAIYNWEAGKELSVANARQFSTLHPRCGTSFLLFLALISVLVFAFTGWPNIWQRLAVRLLFFPVVAGLSYEFIRLAGRSSRGDMPGWLKVLISPGLLFQKMTTREPDDAQLEVAIAALRAVTPGLNHGVVLDFAKKTVRSDA